MSKAIEPMAAGLEPYRHLAHSAHVILQGVFPDPVGQRFADFPHLQVSVMRGIGIGQAIGHIEGVAYQDGILGRLHPDFAVGEHRSNLGVPVFGKVL